MVSLEKGGESGLAFLPKLTLGELTMRKICSIKLLRSNLIRSDLFFAVLLALSEAFIKAIMVILRSNACLIAYKQLTPAATFFFCQKMNLPRFALIIIRAKER